jgi:hypothetical protein
MSEPTHEEQYTTSEEGQPGDERKHRHDAVYGQKSLVDIVLAAGDSNCRAAQEYCDLIRERDGLRKSLLELLEDQ